MTVRNLCFLAVLTLFGFRNQILADSFKFEPIPSLYGNTPSGPYMINNLNQVAFTEPNADSMEATIYTPPSTLIELPQYPSGPCGLPLNNCFGESVGFNDKGQIVVSATYSNPTTYSEANFWSGNAWTQIKGPNYNPKSKYPQVVNFGGLNDAGQVVGTFGHLYPSDSSPYPDLYVHLDGSYLWQNGVARTVVDRSAGSGLTEANDINDSGVIVGSHIEQRRRAWFHRQRRSVPDA